MIVNLIKSNNGLFPSLPEDELALNKIKRGEIVTYEITKKRNAKFHRKFFALIGIVEENSDYNTEQLLHLLKLKIGHYESFVNTNGKEVYKPKSISFAKMDDLDFEKFYQKTITVILRDFLPGLHEKELERQVDLILGFV